MCSSTEAVQRIAGLKYMLESAGVLLCSSAFKQRSCLRCISLSTLNCLLNSLSFHFSLHVSLFPFVFFFFTSDHPLTIFSRPLHSITVLFSSFSYSESFFFTLFLFFVLFKFFCYNTFVVHQKYSFINRFLLLLITQFFSSIT